MYRLLQYAPFIAPILIVAVMHFYQSSVARAVSTGLIAFVVAFTGYTLANFDKVDTGGVASAYEARYYNLASILIDIVLVVFMVWRHKRAQTGKTAKF